MRPRQGTDRNVRWFDRERACNVKRAVLGLGVRISNLALIRSRGGRAGGVAAQIRVENWIPGGLVMRSRGNSA